MKIAFIGEAISGFGGMETVIHHLIHKFNTPPFNYQCKAFFFCRKDTMDKGWLAGIDTQYSFSSNKFSFLRKTKHIQSLKLWLQQEKLDIAIAIDPLSCLLVHKARNQANQHFPLFSWPHFSLNHKKHADCIRWADRHLAISSGIRQQMLEKGIADEYIHTIYNPTSPTSIIIPAPLMEKQRHFYMSEE